MPAPSLAAHLEAVAPTATSPFHFLALVYSWFASIAGKFIDTPAERASIESTVMAAYDKLAMSMASSNPALAALFVAFRGMVQGGLDAILLAFTPPPAPTPTPVPVPVQPPVGAAP